MVIDGTNGLIPPGWTTATRPSTPSNSQSGYNSDIGAWEYYYNGFWIPMTNYSTAENPIINGAMEIDQVNAGAAVSVTASGPFRSVDMFTGFGTASAGVFSLQQMSDTPPAGFKNYLRIKTTTADASPAAGAVYVVSHLVEGSFFSRFSFGTSGALNIALPLRVRSSIAGTFSGSIVNGSMNRCYPFTYTVSSGQVNTWIPLLITLQGDTSGTWATGTSIGAVLYFDVGSGSTYQGTAGAWAAANHFAATGATKLIQTLNATLDITGVDMVAGNTTRPYPHRDDLSRCQRYFYVMPYGYYGFPSPSSGGYAYVQRYDFKVTMRIAPTPNLAYSNLVGLTLVTPETITTDFITIQYVASGMLNATWNMSGTFDARL